MACLLSFRHHALRRVHVVEMALEHHIGVLVAHLKSDLLDGGGESTIIANRKLVPNGKKKTMRSFVTFVYFPCTWLGEVKEIGGRWVRSLAR